MRELHEELESNPVVDTANLNKILAAVRRAVTKVANTIQQCSDNNFTYPWRPVNFSALQDKILWFIGKLETLYKRDDYLGRIQEEILFILMICTLERRFDEYRHVLVYDYYNDPVTRNHALAAVANTFVNYCEELFNQYVVAVVLKSIAWFFMAARLKQSHVVCVSWTH